MSSRNAETVAVSGDSDTRVVLLLALEELRALKAQYTRRADVALRRPSHEAAVALADLFTDDASTDYGPFGTFQGREALINAFHNILPAGTAWSMHYAMNPLLEVDGDTASGNWTFFIQALPTGQTVTMQFYGEYLEKYRKVSGKWKISELAVRYASP
jgi:SnoaL-like protein